MLKQQESETIFSIEKDIKKNNVIERIEQIALEKNIDLISAVMEFAYEINWNPEWLAPYITGPLKEKIRIEGEKLGLLKKQNKTKILFE